MGKEKSSKVDDGGQNRYEIKCKHPLNCYWPLILSGAGKVQGALATQMTSAKLWDSSIDIFLRKVI